MKKEEKISVSLPPGLVKVLDRICDEEGTTRSALITKVLINELYIPCPTCGQMADKSKAWDEVEK